MQRDHFSRQQPSAIPGSSGNPVGGLFLLGKSVLTKRQGEKRHNRAMFSLIHGCMERCFEKPTLNLLIIGLDYAGKSTILEAIKTEFTKKQGISPDKIHPTIGMNLARITHKGRSVVFWDLGGQLKMRSMWERYYDEASAVIFVLDASDMARLEEARRAYDTVRNHPTLRLVPLILFGNKSDLPSAITVDDIAQTFGLKLQVKSTTIVFSYLETIRLMSS